MKISTRSPKNSFVLPSAVFFAALASSANAQSLGSFTNKWNGKYCGSGQCVALAHEWAKTLGKDIPSHAYAYQYAYSSPSGWKWITNTPSGVPKAGDLVVWGSYPSAGLPYGHIDVYSSGNVNSFTGFDQNWPLGSPCHFVNHNYKYVLGWLHKV